MTQPMTMQMKKNMSMISYGIQAKLFGLVVLKQVNT